MCSDFTDAVISQSLLTKKIIEIVGVTFITSKHFISYAII